MCIGGEAQWIGGVYQLVEEKASRLLARIRLKVAIRFRNSQLPAQAALGTGGASLYSTAHAHAASHAASAAPSRSVFLGRILVALVNSFVAFGVWSCDDALCDEC